jgi:glycosyltransferase involved in cell wall biosynthesis
MDTDPISVVVTVRNDREGLRDLLPGLATQTEPPDELVIVDGGSVDGTLEVLDGLAIPGVSVRTIVAPGANIAAGRNVGVRLARNELIACTDAGCRPEPGWLAALARGLERADLVGGVFVADDRTPFEQTLSLTYYPVPGELDDPGPFMRLAHRLYGRSYLSSRPGGRTMAFRRDAWAAAGGFPEHQYAGEDQAFAHSVVDRGFKATFARQAVVHWRPPSTWTANARMFYTYCRGDVRARGRKRHLVRLLAWTIGPIGALRGGAILRALIGSGFLSYIALPLRRASESQIPVRKWWRIPVAVAVKDISQIAGAARGALDYIQGSPQPTPQRSRDCR